MNGEKEKATIRQLLTANCLESAEKLCTIFISSCGKHPAASSGNHAVENQATVKNLIESLELMGDILFRKSQFKRALTYYKQSSQQRKLSYMSQQKSRHLTATASFENESDSQLCYKECLCHLELNDSMVALRALEQIPHRLRDVRINMMLGKLYKQSCHTPHQKRQAIACYSKVVEQMPSAIEAFESLVSLGMGTPDLMALIDTACRERIDTSSSHHDGWLNALVTSLIHKRNHEHDKCNIQLTKLLSLYPKNVYLLTALGCNAVSAEKFDDASVYFKQVRTIDANAIDHMDQYGLLLMRACDDGELSKLANEVLSVSSDRPEGWMLLSMFCDLKGEIEKALQFADKAIAIDGKYSPAYRLKGQLLLAHGHPEQAVVVYSQANQCPEKDIATYSGLVQSHIAIGKLQDAVNYAKEAIKEMPGSPSAYCIFGKVLMQAPNGNVASEAIKAFGKALKLSPDNIVAASHMAEALMSQGKVDDTVICLREILEKRSSSALRVLLGKALYLQGKLGEAVEQFHMALSLRPSVEAATEISTELERVETMMREESGLHANDENNGQAFDEYEEPADEDDMDGEMEAEEFVGDDDEELMDEDEGYSHEEDEEVDGIVEDSPDHDTYNQMHSMEQSTTRRSSHGQRRTNISTNSSSSNRAIDLNRFAGFHDDAEYDDEDEDDRAVGVLYDSDDPDQDMAIAHAAAAAFSSEGEEEEVIGRRRGRASGQRSSSSATSNRSSHVTPSDSRLYSSETTTTTSHHRSNGRRTSSSSSSSSTGPTLGNVPDSVRRTTRSMTSRTPST